MSSSATPGSLEEMLDSLGRRNTQKAKDAPPALPARPTSRTRLPSNRRAALPEIVEAVMELSRGGNEGGSKGSRWKSAGAKTVRQVRQGESTCLAVGAAAASDEEKLAGPPPESSFGESEQDTECFIDQIGAVEIQKCFRCHLARRNFHKLKGGSITLQSYVRGEIARREYVALLKKQVDSQKLDEAVVQLQSVIRGWVIRRQFINSRELEELNTNEESEMMVSKMQQEVQTELSLSFTELQKRLVIAERDLAKKERENAELREQLQQYEAKLLEYESKMRSTEETRNNQVASSQMSLVAARKRTSSQKSSTKSEKSSDVESPRFYDCEDASPMNSSAGSLVKFSSKSTTASTCGDKGGLELAVPLANELEQKKHKFDDEAQAIIKLKSLNTPWLSPRDELHNLKNRLSAWKTGFKGRVKDENTKSQKSGEADGNKARRKWTSLKLK
ncbi:myosin-1-like [Salvia divinorum]|uniref:Myosin-1-like n=1 Tax=Salvia divinorum TaxID=28513 RepID=A0ABD1G0X2_SALDI